MVAAWVYWRVKIPRGLWSNPGEVQEVTRQEHTKGTGRVHSVEEVKSAREVGNRGVVKQCPKALSKCCEALEVCAAKVKSLGKQCLNNSEVHLLGIYNTPLLFIVWGMGMVSCMLNRRVHSKWKC